MQQTMRGKWRAWWATKMVNHISMHTKKYRRRKSHQYLLPKKSARRRWEKYHFLNILFFMIRQHVIYLNFYYAMCAHFLKYEFNNRHLACQATVKRDRESDADADIYVCDAMCGFVGASLPLLPLPNGDSLKIHLRAQNFNEKASSPCSWGKGRIERRR